MGPAGENKGGAKLTSKSRGRVRAEVFGLPPETDCLFTWVSSIVDSKLLGCLKNNRCITRPPNAFRVPMEKEKQSKYVTSRERGRDKRLAEEVIMERTLLPESAF